MKKVHAAPRCQWHFPLENQRLVDRKHNWTIRSPHLIPGLDIFDSNAVTNIDVCIPGISKKQIEIFGHRPCIKQSAYMPQTRRELVHIMFPKDER
jgi:hypothetical protein